MEFGGRRAGALTTVTLVAATLAAGGCSAVDSAPVALGPVSSTLRTAAAHTTPPVACTDYAPKVDPYAGKPFIDHTRWTNDPDGRRLHIVPTEAGRKDWFPDALTRAWGEVLTEAPDADTPGMFDQFECHWQWARWIAPDKPEWNLEPWRPAVGYDATVKAMCNPGGPDPAGK
jgi:hypothetical protein